MKLPVASHTFLNDWANCQHKAFRKFIKKDLPREPQSDAMKWGNVVHTAFEARLKGEAWPPELSKYERFAAPMIALGAKPEHALGIDANGSPCGFWDGGVWLRGKIDSPVIKWDHQTGHHAAAIFDWKTGKRREEKAELAVHAVLLKALHPSLVRIVGHYVWLQDMEIGKPHDVSDTEAKLAEIRSVMNTVANQLEVEYFPKKQNPLCGWCPVTDCEFNRKGK